MLGKMAGSSDPTSFGTAETPGAPRRPPVASREPRRLLSSTPFQDSSGECRTKIPTGPLDGADQSASGSTVRPIVNSSVLQNSPQQRYRE